MHAAAEGDVAFQVPAAHGDTSLPLPVYPAFAKQSRSSVEAVAAVLVWSGQGVHVPFDRASALYVRAAHSVTPLPAPVYPAFARQSAESVVPASTVLLILFGQFSQSSMESCLLAF